MFDFNGRIINNKTNESINFVCRLISTYVYYIFVSILWVIMGNNMKGMMVLIGRSFGTWESADKSQGSF